MPVITIFGSKGGKERRPVGYGGGLCDAATAPYEAREIPGQLTKTPTAEACEVPAAEVAEGAKAVVR